MAIAKLSEIVGRLSHRLPEPNSSTSDSELLARFLQTRNEEAFALLVRWHGPLVLGIGSYTSRANNPECSEYFDGKMGSDTHRCQWRTCAAVSSSLGFHQDEDAAMTDEQKRIADERRKRTFLLLNGRPNGWADAAERHKRAADFLYDIGFRGANRTFEHPSGSREIKGQEAEDWYDSEMLTEYGLLAGLAVECLLKACCVVVNPELVTEEEVTQPLRGHKQKDFAALCCLVLTVEESAILKHFTEEVVNGKYPGPLKAKDLAFTHSEVFNTFRDRAKMDAIYNRVWQYLESIQDQSQPDAKNYITDIPFPFGGISQ